MRANTEFPKQPTDSVYCARLIKLGVPEEFLQSNQLNFALLHQRLSFIKSKIFFNKELVIKDRWQVETLGRREFYGDDLKEIVTLRDNIGASPIHYAAWSGYLSALEMLHPGYKKYLRLERT